MWLKHLCSSNIFSHFEYGSWSYDGFKLDVNFYYGVMDLDIQEYYTNNEWMILATAAVKNVR